MFINDGRHISLVSKNTEVLEKFKKVLGLDVKIGVHNSGHKKGSVYRVQFGDILFYKYLQSIGLSTRKSLTIGAIKIEDKYFFDYLRGAYDGDGCFYSYYDPRWRSSHMFYLCFCTGSKLHVEWLRKQILEKAGVLGHITKSKRKGSVYNLKYAKQETLEIIKRMYYTPRVVCLTRKKIKIFKALEIERKQQKEYKKLRG